VRPCPRAGLCPAEPVDQHPRDEVVDGDFVTWRRYGNCAWPAIYLIDRRRKIRFVQVGEGRYAETEQEIETLLSEQ